MTTNADLPLLWRRRPGGLFRMRLDLFDTEALLNGIREADAPVSIIDRNEMQRVLRELHGRAECIECGCGTPANTPLLRPAMVDGQISLRHEGGTHAHDCPLRILEVAGNPTAREPVAPAMTPDASGDTPIPPFNNLTPLIRAPIPGG